MSNKVFKIQQNNTQSDTIKQSDTTGDKESFQKTFRQNILSNKSKENLKSILVKKIEDGYDATSYIYSVSGESVPLADNFLNPAYFAELNITKKSEELSSSVNSKSIKPDGTSKLSIDSADFLLLVLIFLLALIGFVKINGKSYLQRTLSSILSFSYSHMLYNERNKSFQLNDLILLFVFHISLGLLLVSAAEYYNILVDPVTKFSSYLGYIGITFVAIYAYKLIIRLIGMFLSHYKVVGSHLFYVNNILKFLGIFNVIILFGILFAPESTRILFLFTIIFTYIIAYITRGFKIISDFLTNQFSLSYLILYFCALEIIPIIMIAKLFFAVYQNKIEIFQFV